MPRSSIRPFIILFLILGATLSSFAQSGPSANGAGIAPFSSQTGSPYDAINLSSSGRIITLPIRSKGGPIGFSFALQENPTLLLDQNLIWYLPTPGILNQMRIVTGSSVQGVGVTSSPHPTTCQVNPSIPPQAYNEYDDTSIVDSTGASHAFAFSGGLYYNPCTNTPSVPIGTSTTTADGSGYTVVLTGIGALTGPDLTVYDRSGNIITNVSNPSTDRTVTTPNGLVVPITINNSGPYTEQYGDPLGPTALTSVVPIGTGSVGATITYQDSSGNPQTATYSLGSYSVRTNFGCYGAKEAYPYVPTVLPSGLTLPNGRQYSITYEPTPGFPGNVTGRIASIGLPDGGQISYQYTGGDNNTGVYCDQVPDLINGIITTPTIPILTRTISDANGNQSVWVYNFSDSPDPQYANTTTTVTDPAGNTTVYQFQWGYQIEQQAYQGAVSPSHLLKTVITCYNGNFTNCTTATNNFVSNITQKDVYTSYNNGPASLVETIYNTVGLPSEVKQYDYGVAMPPTGSPLVDTTTSYGSWNGSSCATIPNFINDRPCEVTVHSPSGIASDTRSTYDNAGNLTQVGQLVSGSTYITKSYSYASNGAMQTATDGNSNVTTYTNGACNNLLPTKIASGGLSITEAWDCNGAVLTSQSGSNPGQTTTYSYADPMYRLTSTTYPDGGATNVCYSDVGGASCSKSATVNSVYTTTLASPDANLVNVVTSDGLDRPITETAPSGATTNIVYSSEGNITSISNPYISTTDQTYGITSYAYDALNRITMQCQPDNGTGSGSCVAGSSYLQWSYSGNSTTQKDEAGIGWQRTSDALGRLKNVVEPGNLTTAYSYDALGNLLSVTQTGASGETPRTRSFTYDSLSRLITSQNPETGTTCYGAWSGVSAGSGTCQGGYDGNGNLLQNTNADNLHTVYQYDVLNRLTSRFTPGTNDLYINNYDATGSGVSNGIGRLTSSVSEFSPLSSSTSSGATDTESYSYDAMGRVIQLTTAVGSRTATVSATYDLAGNSTKITYPDGRVTSQTYDGAGRLTTVTDATPGGTPTSYIAGASGGSIGYTPAGAEHSFILGNGVSQTNNYNNRLQRTRTMVSTPALAANANGGNLFDRSISYNPSGPSSCTNGGNNGNIWSIVDNLQADNTQSFSYDCLNRLTTAAQSGGSYNQTYNLDSFGNMTITDNLQNSNPWGIDPATNRLLRYASNVNVYQYNNSGNLISTGTGDIGGHYYVYNGANQVLTVDVGHTAYYMYNAPGNRVLKQTPGVLTDYVYFGGLPLAEWNTTSGWSDYIYANGQRISRIDTGDSVHYYTVDHLGSASFITNAQGGVESQSNYTPFGVELPIVSGDSNDYKFTGKESDTESGLDYFGARYYGSTMGRFMSPDYSTPGSAPVPVPKASFDNPQSLNLYSYVLNNPLVNVDPDGHDPCGDTEATGALGGDGLGLDNGDVLVGGNNPPPNCEKEDVVAKQDAALLAEQQKNSITVTATAPSDNLAIAAPNTTALASGPQAPNSPSQPGKRSKSACNAQRVANAIPGATLTGNNTFQGGHEEFGIQVSGGALAGAGFSFYTTPFGNGNGYRTPFSGTHVNGQPGNITVAYAYGATLAGQAHFDVGNASSGFGGFAEHSFVDVFLGTLLGWIPALHNFLDPGC